LLLLPTEKLMKNHRVMKLQPSIEAMPDLDKKIKRGKTKSDIGDNDKMSFAGGSLIFGHSNSTANYRSLSFPYICLDDVDAFPLDVNE
ncbi:phage terminase large subunit family protein, partial [Aliarcobacter butzleri]